MRVPLSTQEIPPIVNVTQAEAQVCRMKQGLQAFVLRAAGATVEEAFTNVQPALEANDFVIIGGRELGINIRNKAQEPLPPGVRRLATRNDFGWHTDNDPSPYGPEVSMINLHYVEKGSALFQAVEPTSELRRLRVWHQLGLERKRVNPRLFMPVLWETVLEPEDLLFLRTGGHQPMAHSFVTITAPRSARIKRAVPHDSIAARLEQQYYT